MIANRIFKRAKVRIKKAQKQLWSTESGPRMESTRRWSDEAFLQQFAIDSVQNALANSGAQAANEALLAHYANRVESGWLGCPALLSDLDLPIARMSMEAILATADRFLEQELFTNARQPKYHANGDVDWTHNPTDDAAWLRRLNRHQWWPVWGWAYAETGDERYAEAFAQQLESWIQRAPVPKTKDEKNPQWRLMETGQRMVLSWIPAFALFYKSPAFTEQLKLRMLRSFYEHGQFLSLFYTNRNHLLRESNGLAYVATYFNEFRSATEWQALAFKRLAQELKSQINPDGTQIEVSTGYQWLVIDEFEKTYDLLKTHNLSLPNVDLAHELRNMYRVVAHLTRPDGSFPQVNDGFLHWSHEDLAAAGAKFGWDELVYVGNQGSDDTGNGTAPDEKSVAFENAGLYVMRSTWKQDSHYLLLNAGPFGGPHGHEDNLSIEVAAFGQPFLVDSGSYTYDHKDPFRTYFVGSQGHNTVLVDGKSQVRRWIPENLHPELGYTSDALWRSTDAFDYAKASYQDGYGDYAMRRPANAEVASDVTHTRRVLFVKPHYWLVVDELVGTKTHDYQLLFHAQPGLTVSAQSGKRSVLTSSKNGVQLAIIPAQPEELERTEITGQEEPVQGWYSSGYNQRQPATTTVYTRKNSSSCLFATLLYPLSAGEEADAIQFEPLEVTDDSALAYQVTTERGKDTLLLSDSGKKIHFGSFESSASVARICTDHDGNVLEKFELA